MDVPLREIAYARSGDKGGGANVGLIAYTPAGYEWLVQNITAENIGAMNFVLPNILAGGGSRSLRLDAQGKALGQALLEMRVHVPEASLAAMRRMEATPS